MQLIKFSLSLFFILLIVSMINSFIFLFNNAKKISIVNIYNFFDKLNVTNCIHKSNISQYGCYNMHLNLVNISYYYIQVRIMKYIILGEKNIFINSKKKYISSFSTEFLNQSYYILFLKDLFFNQYGSIITKCNDFISLKGGCRCKNEINFTTFNYKNLKNYSLVFQITQYLGSSIYHSLINCLTKIIPIYSIIKSDSKSKLHVHNTSSLINYLNLLDIRKDRLIYGDFYSQRTVIMQRVECTSSIYTHSIIQLRDMLLKKASNLRDLQLFNSLNTTKLLIIKRLYSRRIKNFDSLKDLLCYRKEITCRIYYPNTKFNIMINMFSNADVIFGPHGAGFTNILLSKPNVKIFEIIKKEYPVLCFASLSQILGFKYFGVYHHYNTRTEEFMLNLTYIFNLFLYINI